MDFDPGAMSQPGPHLERAIDQPHPLGHAEKPQPFSRPARTGIEPFAMILNREVQGIAAAPVYDYGVTMFITIGGPAIYLRKGG